MASSSTRHDMAGAGSAFRTRAAFAILALTVAIWVAKASLAWGCVPQPWVTIQPRASAPSGTQVTVDGRTFGTSRAEVRWNGQEGPLLGTANGPSFTLPVTIPEAPRGLYSLVVLSRDPGGGVGSVARAAFEVTGPGDDTAATPPAPAGATGTTAIQKASSRRSTPSVAIFPWGLAIAGGLVALGGVSGALARKRRSPSNTANSDL